MGSKDKKTAARSRPHGTRAKYNAEGCRCAACKKANADYERRRLRKNAYGRSDLVDAGRAREHVRYLMARPGAGHTDGMSWRRVAKAAGLSESGPRNSRLAAPPSSCATPGPSKSSTGDSTRPSPPFAGTAPARLHPTSPRAYTGPPENVTDETEDQS